MPAASVIVGVPFTLTSAFGTRSSEASTNPADSRPRGSSCANVDGKQRSWPLPTSDSFAQSS
jgi:hypothetical protein